MWTVSQNFLNEHWELSKQLDAGSTNTCIDQMLIACQDLICGQFIAGAVGGGFLQGNPEKKASAGKCSKSDSTKSSKIAAWTSGSAMLLLGPVGA